MHPQTAMQGGLLAFIKECMEERLSPCLMWVLVLLLLSATS